MQQELLIQTKAETTYLPNAKRSITRFVSCFVFSGLILFGLKAAAQPNVTSLSAVVGQQGSAMTITGTGFNATPANNIVYFGGAQATVTGGSATSLSVLVPRGTTYAPVTVLNTGTSTQGWSPYSFLQDFSTAGYASTAVNFDPKVDFATGTGPSGIAIGDLNGDGWPDVVVGCAGAKTVAIYINTAGAAVTPMTPARFAAPIIIPTTINCYIISLADIDGDGKLDIGVGAQVSNNIATIRNTSASWPIAVPTFAAPAYWGSGNLPYTVRFGDLDADGKPEMIAINNTSNSVTIFRNTSAVGTIAFTGPTVFAAGGTQPVDVAVQDIDGDGKRDLVVASAGGAGQVTVFRNTTAAPGAYAFVTSAFVPPYPSPEYIVVGDIDGDGKADITVGTKGIGVGILDKVLVYLNHSASGSITLAAPVAFPALPIEGMVGGDFDGDGKLDIAATYNPDTMVAIYRNTSTIGTPNFTICEFKTGLSPGFDAAGDLDGDGLTDLAVCNYNSNNFSVLKNEPLQSMVGHQICASGIDSVQFTEAALGGTWTSSCAIVIVDTFSGYVKGNGSGLGGTCTITYNEPCATLTAVVTVNASPTGITGGNTVCIGTTTTLNGIPAGGTWISYYTSIATIGATTGVVTGGSAGYDTIKYYIGLPTCYLLTTVNVFNPPAAITGSLNVCVGLTTQLTDASAPGTWNMVNGNATITGGGLVTGVNGGATFTTDSVIFTQSSTTCTTSKIVTVNALPGAINGNLTICAGSTTQLTDATPGGTWSTSDPTVGGVSGTGLVTGAPTVLVSSSCVITYTMPTGCIMTATVNVNPIPTPILGNLSVCVGGNTTLTDASGPGTWSSATVAVATIGSLTGTATGVSGGVSGLTDVITYKLNGTGCATTAVLTVYPTPASITGTLTVCQNATTQLTDATAGGTWSSSNPGNGSVNGSGLVTGVTGSTTTTITYTSANGCAAPTVVVTINPLPGAINGSGTVCVGSSITLTDAPAGGAWTSSAPGVGSIISGTGVLTGVSSGTTSITYTLPTTGCATTPGSFVVTVNPLPAAITGASSVCVGQVISLSSTTGGGVWTSTNPGSATVDASGNVTGVAPPSTVISYTLPATGCGVAKTIAVNALPSVISGATSVCVGATITLSDLVGGGTWANPPGTVASVTTGPSATTTVTGLTSGTTVVTYTAGAGCFQTYIVTVNPNPVAITPAGIPNVCIGGTTQLTDLTPGGNWSSSATGSATVVGGLVTGVTCPTTPYISYTLPATGCYVVEQVSVDCLPVGPAGAAICVGATTTLTATPAGGTWTSGTTSVATVSATGVVTGVSGGTSIITYALPTGCINTAIITVNPNPATITGTLSVCVGLTSQLTDATVGGNWTSSATGVATISFGAGLMTGVSAAAGGSTATITYTIASTGCYTTAVATVNPNPGAINGTLSVCQGLSTTLTDLTAGGTWSSSSSNVTVVAGTGVVTGAICPGTAPITYMLVTGCINTATVNVNCNPAPINGGLTVCVGSTTQLTDATLGGTWFSSNTAVATISGTGLVNGLTPGTTNITYTGPTGGCIGPVVTVTVNALPTAINGTRVVCQGQTTSLSDGTTGGTWTSSATTIATVDPTGLVTGINGGVAGSTTYNTAVITYTLGTGCIVTAIVTVNPLPAPISGPSPLAVCVGSSITLTSSPAGGTWSSSTPGNGSVGSTTGIVTGVSGGSFPPGFTTTNIVYTGSNGCATASAGAIVTINANPTAILGASAVCVGSSISLSDAVGGGTWFSSATVNATVDPFGNVTGLFGGPPATTTTITYTLPTTCFITKVVSVNPLPTAITGTATVCVGLTTALTDGIAGGTWSSSNPFIGSVSTTGVVTGVSAVPGGSPVTITYALGTGCAITTVVTVYPLPTPILGNNSVCVGSTTSLSDATAGGNWSSACADMSISGTGLVTGFAQGTCIVTYTLLTGCIATQIVTINPLPTAILGNLAICVGSSSLLTDATLFGTWTSSIPANVSIGLGTGNATGNIASTTSTITYTLPTGCIATAVATVNPLPAAINGTFAVCQGLCTTLTDATPGGSWSSQNISDATAGSSTGLVCGVAGFSTTTITYTLPTTCYTVQQITVNALPTAINGNLNVCQGLTTQLTDATPGGTWSSSLPGNGSIDPSTGIATGVTGGTTTIITYTLGTGCITTAVLTINSLPTSILGTPTVCSGLTTTLTDATAGGAWSISNPFVAAFETPPSGVLTGVATVLSTATVTYTMPSSCYITTTVTVYPLPSNITGTLTVCSGSTTSLTDASPGGTWSSSTPLVGSIDPVTGVVTGGAFAGTTTITYTLGTGCIITTVVTVNALPTAILGNLNVCIGASTQLSDASPGGSWLIAPTSIATAVPATGLVTGVSAGTAIVTYTLPTTCSITATVTVNPNPTSILPPSPQVCVGSTIILSDATVGGSWSGSNPSIGIVGAGSGSVTGMAAGIFIDTYTLPTTCFVFTLVTVNALPAPINGTFSVCQGLCTTLTDATPGGTWTSGNITDAIVGSTSGSVCGINGGLAGTTDPITYTLTSTGCFVTATMTIDPIPGVINGPNSVCVGLTIQVTDGSAGGAWTSSDPTIASINPGTGLVTGISPGTVIITYAFATTCQATYIITVNPNPVAITGTFVLCQGSTVTLVDGTPGGTWSSSNPGVASISSTGLVTGLSGGTTTDTYALATGCNVTQVVTVNPLPSPIVGLSGVCVGSTITLADITGGGTWTSSNSGIASVSAVGVVTGVATGIAYITYTLPAGGCYVTHVVNVSTTPPPITGTTTICTGSSVMLTDLLAGGTWTSSNPPVASIDAFGVTTGNSAGTAIITYLPPSGCPGTTVVTVYPTPAIPTGSLNVCVGLTTTLTDVTPGGTWSSTPSTVASVGGTTGVVTGMSGGTAVISYTMATYCYATTIVTVNNNPSPINGSATICLFSSTVLEDGGAGGNWSSIPGTGLVTVSPTSGTITTAFGAAVGTDTIVYTVPSGCKTILVMTVEPLPASITGSLNVCVGATTALTDVSAGGTWSSIPTSVATVGTTGIVTGVAAGTATIAYATAGGCSTSVIVTVNAIPAAITGNTAVCKGFTTQLSDVTAGGTWSSSNPGNGSVNSTGLVTGVTGGTSTTITYTSAAGCFTTVLVTVNSIPAPINGTLIVCVGNTTTLTDATGLGTWTSSNITVDTVDLFTGVVTGINGGTSTITYMINLTGCYTTAMMTVNPLPSAITGNLSVCVGSTTQLSDAIGGGTWSISGTHATISGTGLVSGTSAGTGTVTYTSASGCFITATVTVNALPSAITGTMTVCVGLTTTLSDATTGGTWASNNTAVETIGLSSGIATGNSFGTATDTYTLGTGCYVTAIVTVNPLPAPISGTLTVCNGLTTTLTDISGAGTWVSSNTAVAPIGSTSGIVTGMAVGTATETFTLPTSCMITAVVTVNPLPLAINGTTALCALTSTTLTDVTTGGLWSSGSTGVATINPSTGLLTGVSGGTSTITYTLGTGCIATTVVTVYAVPANITGPLTVCVGSTTNLTDLTPGGLWISSIPPLATIGVSTGIATGISAGTVVITYILPSPTGCQTTAVLTINPVPAPILGSPTICFGLTEVLSDVTPGGSWSASAGGAILSGGTATGLVYGAIAGSTGTVSYTLPTTGCSSILVMTVNPLPAAITGTMNVCIGLTTTLSDASTGGTWSSSTPAVATVTSGGGVVTGVSTGSTTITYMLPTGCINTATVTVNPVPTAILGSSGVCYGATMTLSDLTPGGNWSSSDITVATVSPTTGVVTGVNLGTATISYTNPATGCYATKLITVNKEPSAILGNPVVCVGLTVALSDTSAGGTWSSSSPSIGSVGATTGIVTGASAGTTVVTYSVASSCMTSVIVTVNPLPVTISGALNLCAGLTSTLSDASGGGTWSSSNLAVATVGSATGVVSAITTGTSTITYTLSTGCIITAVVTVHPNPAAISGSNKVCIGSTITLSDVTPGGVWTSSNSAVAPVSSTGVVTGVTVGTATISYSPAVGCNVQVTITVNPLPSVFTVYGGGSYCQGGNGVPIGLNGSNVGISYLLFYGSSATGYLAGTGDTLHFGLLTVPGVYSVQATGSTTGCSIGMLSTVTVNVTPTVNPTVAIHVSPADTMCPGTTVTLTATSAPTSTVTPTYVWYVNGTAVSTSAAYSFMPANGDLVKVAINSGAVCIFPTTATDTLRLHVLQNGNPTVHITVNPGDTVCQYASALFTATSTFGGLSPVYTWLVNSLPAGTGPEFSYVPNTGDQVSCKITSDYLCASIDTAHSNVITMDVVPMIIPHIDIIAHPGLTVVEDSTELLTTVVTGAGPDPTYVWKINGVPVPGATNSSYSSNSFHNYDSVTCIVTSSGYCEGISTFDWVYITIIPTGVGSVQYVGVSNIMLIPNPNTGAFNIKGSLATTTDEDLAIEVTDMLGQVIYKKQIRSDNGKVNQQIDLGNNLANGMYILNISGGNENKSFHFVVER